MATRPAGKRAKKASRAPAAERAPPKTDAPSSTARAALGKTSRRRRSPGRVPGSRPVRCDVPLTSSLSDDSTWTTAEIVALLSDGMPHSQEDRLRRDRARKRLGDHLRRGLIVQHAPGVFN